MHKDIKFEELDLKDISPQILRCSIFSEGRNMAKGHRLGKRYVYDYELELFTFSEGEMEIEGETYEVSSGDLVFRKPGQLVEGVMPYSCYLLCVDLTGNTEKNPESYNIYDQTSFQNYYLNDFINSIPSVLHPDSYDTYFRLFDEILREYINPSVGSTFIIKSNILRIFYEIWKDMNMTLNGNTSVPHSPHYNRLKKSIDFIGRNYNKRISLSDISEVSGLSPTYFHKVFCESLKTTPNNYLNKFRLEKAKEFLVKTDLPINRIAQHCGFENTPYFSSIFKKYYGLSPLDFRGKYKYY